MKQILVILGGIVTMLLWFFNPKAAKERKLTKLRAKLEEVKSEREKARQAGDNDRYNLLNVKRLSILTEISRLTGK